MAAKEYLVKAIKKGKTWDGPYGSMQNYALSLQGIGEPVKLSLPEPIIEDPEAGDHLYGNLTEQKVNDRIYYELKLQKKVPDDPRQVNINTQWAIGQAILIYNGGEYATESERRAAYDNIEAEAKHFYKMIDKFKEY